MPNAADLAAMAMKRIGALGSGETPSNEDEADVLERLNTMINTWSAERLMIYETERVTHNLTANDETYTIGSGGNIDRTRPEFIEAAGIVFDRTITNPVETPIDVINVWEYAAIPVKSTPSTYPTRVYYDYDHTSARGLLTLWPVHSGASVQLVLYLPTAISTFASRTTTYSLPGGYEEALRDNLAIVIAPEFGKAVPDELTKNARMTKAILKRKNRRWKPRQVDRALWSKGGSWNWYSGEPVR